MNYTNWEKDSVLAAVIIGGTLLVATALTVLTLTVVTSRDVGELNARLDGIEKEQTALRDELDYLYELKVDVTLKGAAAILDQAQAERWREEGKEKELGPYRWNAVPTELERRPKEDVLRESKSQREREARSRGE